MNLHVIKWTFVAGVVAGVATGAKLAPVVRDAAKKAKEKLGGTER
jgi:hypothetical protein